MTMELFYIFLFNNNRIIWKCNLIDPTKGVDFYNFESWDLHEKHAVATRNMGSA